MSREGEPFCVHSYEDRQGGFRAYGIDLFISFSFKNFVDGANPLMALPQTWSLPKYLAFVFCFSNAIAFLFQACGFFVSIRVQSPNPASVSKFSQ